MRELKLLAANSGLATDMSHPLRVRELKLSADYATISTCESHPLRVRELKRGLLPPTVASPIVAPFTGA